MSMILSYLEGETTVEVEFTEFNDDYENYGIDEVTEEYIYSWEPDSYYFSVDPAVASSYEVVSSGTTLTLTFKKIKNPSVKTILAGELTGDFEVDGYSNISEMWKLSVSKRLDDYNGEPKFLNAF